jgi:hypothetical protein
MGGPEGLDICAPTPRKPKTSINAIRVLTLQVDMVNSSSRRCVPREVVGKLHFVNLEKSMA